MAAGAHAAITRLTVVEGQCSAIIQPRPASARRVPDPTIVVVQLVTTRNFVLTPGPGGRRWSLRFTLAIVVRPLIQLVKIALMIAVTLRRVFVREIFVYASAAGLLVLEEFVTPDERGEVMSNKDWYRIVLVLVLVWLNLNRGV